MSMLPRIMAWAARLQGLSPGLPMPLRLAAALEMLGGGGGAAVSYDGTYDRSALDVAEGDHIEAPIYTIPATGTWLFYGDIGSIGASNGCLMSSAGGSVSDGSVILRLHTTTEIRMTYRRSAGGAGESAFYAIADATTYGPRLYWGSWSASYSGMRAGVDNMLVGTPYGTNANLVNEAASTDKSTFMSRAKSSGITDRNVTGTGCWGLMLERELTADEWAAAASGDYSWAIGDADLARIFAPQPGKSGNVDASTNITTGGPYTIENNQAGGTDVPMTVTA